MPASDGSDDDGDDHRYDYPPGEWSVDGLTAALDDIEGACPIPTYEDADVWRAIREDEALATVLDRLRAEAAEYGDEPVPRVGAREFATVAASGRKSRAYYETLRRQRRAPTVLALVECLDRDGEHLDVVVEYVWALCEQTSWLSPRQVDDRAAIEGLPRPAHTVAPADRNVTHYTTWTAHELAELDYLLGDRLPTGVRERLRTEIDGRLFEPYETREDFWWLDEASNWNAVCNGRTALAALYLEPDVERLGRIVTKAAHSLQQYLDCFDDDGSTPEGVMYWDYGMRYYVEFAAHLDARTDGRYSLFEPPVVRDIATFPHRVGFRPGRYPPFNDSLERYAPRPSTFFRLGERFDDGSVIAHGWRMLTADDPGGDLHNFPPVDAPSLVWAEGVDDEVRNEATDERYAPPSSAFFGGNDWWVARAAPADPDSLVVAAKGGHNDEPHNHNDCGSVVVSFRDESLLADLGAPSYSRDYGGDGRYDYLSARSLGHSVPFVNGHEQVTGREYAARVVDRTTTGAGDAGGHEDTDSRKSIMFDLTACYPAGAGLDSLRRTVALDRAAGNVEITDNATFRERSEASLDSVVVSYHPIVEDGGDLLVTGGRGALRIETNGEITAVEHLTEAVDMSYRDVFADERPDVWRARVAAADGDSSTRRIELIARPVE